MSAILRNHPSGLLLSFLFGAATGATIALLTAPQSGRETRRKLKEFTGDLADRAARVPAAARAAGREAVSTAREAFVREVEDPAVAASKSRDKQH
jgi:gas vesicle protein